MKYEEIHINDYASVKSLRAAFKKSFHFYNHERPHQSFEGATPVETYYGNESPIGEPA
ncbi:MAG: integrase core domain-containing protein [Cellvibrionaceae bacterium]|nr:integrase core domain-containing protein [Cellvibrionaceae bacterium]